MSLLNQWKGVNGYMINDPGTFFSEYNESHGIGYPIAFMLISYLAVMLPAAVLTAALNITAPGEAAVGVVIFLAFGIAYWILGLVEAVLAHGVVYLFGARGIAKTFEAYAFPTVVRYGLWWFPLVNIALGFYGLYLQIKGLSTFHDISTGKAVIAAALPVVVFMLPGILVIAAVVATFVLDMGSQTGTQPPMLLFDVVA
ncbi:YIP1 family protein [Natrinema salsiterrestre]|uniref:YIP1 family protein n=1 Tax=Natrinema salsiterrestre TaxID=2950540 RepID=A0A9Q4KXU1_9EURY|nr:YIP1 family protein [Natrinema salsiterrestre]MDF9745553.1 YIP1 family protein [Natrinema salsiterrestre]